MKKILSILFCLIALLMCVTCQENNIFLSDVPVQPETPFEEETVEAFLDRLETEIIVVETALDKYLDKCASIDELENYADEIGSLDAVANVSVSNDGMFITTKEGFKISVLYTVCDSTLYDNVELESTISAYATRSQVGSNDHDFVDLREKKICIINQTTKDKNFVEQDLNFRKLIGDIKKAGYKNVDYITATSADVMWFFEKMTEYDVILLCTHGGHDANDEYYVLATGEELPLDIDKQDVHLLKGRAFLKYFLDSDRLTVEQKDKLFSSISLVILNEMRVKEGQLEEHKYFGLTSKAIELIKGDFNDAVIFSTACSGYIIASAFNNKGATYLGYTDTNSVGPFAGCDFMLNMLKGMSVVEARENLKGDYKLEEKTDWKPDNSNKSYTFTSKLCIAGNENICIVHPEVSTGDVNVDGFNAVLHGSVKGTNNIMECKAAFCYSKNKNDLEIGKSGVDSTAWNVIESDLEKEVKFEAELKSLKENTEYYYRAVVKSEENYFYGEVKSFKTIEVITYQADLSTAGSVCFKGKVKGIDPEQDFKFTFCYSETDLLPTVDTEDVVIIPYDMIESCDCDSFYVSISRCADICYRALVEYDGEFYYGDAKCLHRDDFVDLGLSVLWANCNVGAETPDKFGCYFAWGEDSTKYNYVWDTYKFKEKNNDDWVLKLTKYCFESDLGVTDFIGTLLPEDDVARCMKDTLIRMPSKENFEELIEECDWSWDKLNGVDGYKIVGPSGRSIFLPAAEYRHVENGYTTDNTLGYYWSSTLYSGFSREAYSLCFGLMAYTIEAETRSNGFTIRAVKIKEKK